MSFKNLVRFSRKDDDSTLNNQNIAPAVRNALEAVAKKEQEQAADEIVRALQMVGTAKESHLNSLRQLRKQEQVVKQNLQKIDRAEAYATETGNFVPLLVLLGRGYELGDVDGLETEVPKDFRPSVKRAAPDGGQKA